MKRAAALMSQLFNCPRLSPLLLTACFSKIRYQNGVPSPKEDAAKLFRRVSPFFSPLLLFRSLFAFDSHLDRRSKFSSNSFRSVIGCYEKEGERNIHIYIYFSSSLILLPEARAIDSSLDSIRFLFYFSAFVRLWRGNWIRTLFSPK